MWTVFFFVLNASASVLCVLVAISAVRTVRRQQESPRNAIRSCELRLQSLEDSRTETVQMLSDLTNRLKMMRVRSASRHAEGSTSEPDPYKDPDKWRTMMNRRLAESKMGAKL